MAKRSWFDKVWSSLFDSQWNESSKFKMKNYRRAQKAMQTDECDDFLHDSRLVLVRTQNKDLHLRLGVADMALVTGASNLAKLLVEASARVDPFVLQQDGKQLARSIVVLRRLHLLLLL